MRKVLFNLHLYGALIVGLFVVVIGVTGSIMVFEVGLDRLFNPKLYQVETQGRQMPVSGLLAAAAKAYPGQRINSVRLPQDATDSARFGVRGPKQVFMNPYTGQILGERSPKTVLSTIHQLHQRLNMGENGATIVTSVTAVLLFLVVSGIYLWWPQKRLKIKWNAASSWRLHFDIHNVVGFYSAFFLFLLGCTGIVIYFDNDIEQYLLRASGTAKIAKNIPTVVRKGAGPITPDQALQIALAEMPGTKALSLSVPANPKASYLVALHYPEDLTPGGRSWANVDQYSGKVAGFQNSRTAPMGTRAIIINRAIHTGDLFGMVTKVLMCVSGLMLITQAITGYFMWWKKLRARQPGPMQRESVGV
ncbi:MAG: PepSY-associated TM helix domain-containing protein [Bryobacteraceae bacterium]